MLIDLQLHSTYSDGFHTPTEVAKLIASQGVKIAALTDHNTVGGLDEFRRACKKYKIRPVSGIELYIREDNYRSSLLWYNLDDRHPELHDMLRNSQMRRRRQIRSILNKLVERGFRMEVNKTLDKYNHYVPINHIIEELAGDKKNFSKIQKELGLEKPREEDIIRKYFRNKEIGVLRNSYIGLERIARLRDKIGGHLVLCHPAKYGSISRHRLKNMMDKGLDGIEKLSPHHSYGATVYIQHLAEHYDLIETGGTDFHRREQEGLVNKAWDYFRVESERLRRVGEIIG